MNLKCLFAKGAITKVHLSARGGLAGGRAGSVLPRRQLRGGAQPGDLTTLGSKHKVLDTAPSGLLLPIE